MRRNGVSGTRAPGRAIQRLVVAGLCALAALLLGVRPVSSEPPPPGPPAGGGPSTGARYPIRAVAPFASRYPDKAGDFDVPPTLEQLNKPRAYDLDPGLGVHLDGFTLWTLDDFGRHDPSLQEYVHLSGRDMVNGDYHLVVHLIGAPALTDLFFYVRYHDDRFNPRDCQPGSVFGLEGDRLWFTKLNVPGVVCAGMTRVRPDINGGIIVADGVVCEMAFEERPADLKPWWLDRAPDASRNRPMNVQAYADPEDNSVVLYWQEANVGDFNNDGEVSLCDLIVVGRRYGRLSTDGHEDEWDRLPDANGDGEVNYRDVWAIEDNYGALLQGYRIYRRPGGRPRREEIMLPHRTYPILPMSIHRPKDWDPVRINEYRYPDRELARTSRPTEWIYRIVPYNAADDVEGEGSDVEITLRVTDRTIAVR